MQLSGLPTKVTVTWGTSAPGANIRPIPVPSQIGTQVGAASFTDGFPPVTLLPVGAGGTPPFGQDFNGIFRLLTQWTQWQSAGGLAAYDSTFQSSVSGYPAGAIVQSALNSNQLWLNTVDGNANNPDTGSYWGSAPYSTSGPAAGWQALGWTTGDMKQRPTSETQPGWVRANANTVGSASSGGTELASAQAAAIYAWHWTNFSNTQCPVTGGRGASAAADFAANKAIQVLDLRGKGMRGADTMGGGATTNLNGVPVVSGSNTAPGSILGENLHALIIAELASHNHSGWGGFSTAGANTGGSFASWISANGTPVTTNTGSGTAHNNVALDMLATWYIHI